MGSSSDSKMALEYRKGIIKTNISIDTCKECKNILIQNRKILCTNNIPSVDSCNLLKIFYT